MQKYRIMVVDDEENVCELLQLYLEREGFSVETQKDGKAALEAAARRAPDLMILDLMLPGADGWEVCREIRKSSNLPIVMLTARGEDVDKILGLELGADDYLAKPFNPRELVARVKAVLRRARGAQESGEAVLRFPGLEIDSAQRKAHVGEREVALTPKEFDLLWSLAKSHRRAFTRQQLLEQVWGYDYFGDDRTIDVHVKRLRQKIEPDEHPYRYIQTVWGIGYQFAAKEVGPDGKPAASRQVETR